MSFPLIFALGTGVLAIVYGGILAAWINKQAGGDDRMKAIARAIQEGAMAYLSRQYKTVAVAAVIIFALLWIFIDKKAMPITGIGFLFGAILSGLTGFIGMHVSVRANVKTAEAAKKGMSPALMVAVRGGAITGMLVVGLALLAVTVFYMVTKNVGSLIGVAFGASLISVFARIGGGIFTKAADVGTDMVGKVAFSYRGKWRRRDGQF
jgi:K(+)-stimulated pyrophosphate-energized sodium pump